MVGEIHIKFGSMYSGKSSYLKTIAYTTLAINKKVCIINSTHDTRVSNEGIKTHDGHFFPGIKTKLLMNIINTNAFKESHTVLIDEAQFFEDLVEFCLHACEKENKIIYVTGLAEDVNRKKFGSILDLIPYADSTEKLTGYCEICQDFTKGIFTKALFTEEVKENEVKVGGKDLYISVCRKHFLEN